MEDEVVAIFNLGEEQPMPAARLSAFLLAEEGGECGEPLVSANGQIAAAQRIGQFLQALGILAVQEGVGTLAKLNSFLVQAIGQPMVLVEADASREGEVGTNPHEYPSPTAVVDVEIVLGDPALCDLKMPALIARVADGDHDAGGFACLKDHRHLVGLSMPEVGCDELIASATGSLDDRGAPLQRAVHDPVAELCGDIAQDIAADRVLSSIGAEETNHPFRLLERLDHSVEQDAVEAPVAKADAALVMFEKGVHRASARLECCEGYTINALHGVALRNWRSRDIKGAALG